MPKSLFETEIYEQPAALRGALGFFRQNRELFDGLRTEHQARKYRRVMFLGMGASLAAGAPACIFLNARGIPAMALDASEFLHFYLKSARTDTLFILVSQSGESAEIVKILSALGGRHACWGVSNYPKSTLAAGVKKHFCISAGREESCTSKTYVATLLLNYLLALGLTGKIPADIELKIGGLAAAVEMLLNQYREKEFGDIADFFWRGGKDFFVMGRGPSVATTLLGSILLKETCRTNAHGLNTGAFRHGPIEITSADFRAIVCSPSACPCHETDQGIMRDIAAAGGKAVLQTDGECKAEKEGTRVVRLPKTDFYLMPILEILLIEVLCCRIAERKGIPVAEFKHFTKVTTEE